MERRFLPGMYDGRQFGCYATTWDGWKNPRKRELRPAREARLSTLDGIHDVDEATGVYSVLYQPTAGGAHYVAYIGYSINLRRELKERYRSWEKNVMLQPRTKAFPFRAMYISRHEQARAFELDLIRCYAPPWNSRFWKQGQVKI